MKLGNMLVIAIMLTSVAALTGNDGGQGARQRQKSAARMTPIDQQLSPPSVAQSPQDLCHGEWHGPDWAFDPGWFSGQEYYAVYQDPIETGCTDTYPFQVTNVYWSVYNNNLSDVLVEMRPVIYSVDLSNPTCPKPGVVLRRGSLTLVPLTAGGLEVVSLPFDVACCVTGPYFAGVECPTPIGTASMAILIDDGIPLRNCANYNNYRGLWEDLVVDHGFTGNLKLWSDGYNSTQNLCDDCPGRLEAGDNLWETGRDGNLLPTPISPPIPADFFGLGSDPFNGAIFLNGEPLVTDPPGILGQADGVIRRLAPYDGTGIQTIPVEIVALSLVGVDPISVTYDGGQMVELWDIRVCLSMFRSSTGTMDISSTCCKGGDFVSDIQMTPLFVFTRQSDQERRILDYGQLELPPVPCEMTAGKWTGEIPPQSDPGPVTSPGLVAVDHDSDAATSDILVEPSSRFQFTGGLVEPWFSEPCTVPICFESIGQIAFTDSPSAACEDPSGLRIGHLSSALSQPGQIVVEPGPYVPGQIIQTEIVQLELRGSVPGFGDMTIRERTDKASTGEFEVLETDIDGNIIAADGWYEFWPEVEMDWAAPTVNTGGAPLTLHAVWQEGLAEEPLPIQADFVADVDSPLPVELVDAESGVPFGWICGMLWRPTLALPCAEPRPTGACCTEDNSCVETTQAICESNGGYYHSDGGAICETKACPPISVANAARLSGNTSLSASPTRYSESSESGSCSLSRTVDYFLRTLPWLSIPCRPYLLRRHNATSEGPPNYEIPFQLEGVAFEGEATANPDGLESPLIVRQRPYKITQGRIDVGEVDGEGNLTAGRIYMDFFPEFVLADSGLVLNTGDIPFRIESEITDMKLTGVTLSPRPSAAPLRLITPDNEHWGWVCGFSMSGAPAPVGDPFAGLEFSQVDYTFDNASVPNSQWGRLEVDVETFTAAWPYRCGYLNVTTDLGWVVQNLCLKDLGCGGHIVSVTHYFQLGCEDEVDITSLSAHVEFTEDPVITVSDDPRQLYSVTTVEFNSEGGGELETTLTGDPIAPNTIVFDALGITEVLSQPNQVNVQAAKSQCFPMSIANSLQYLEDRYGLPVPHDHVAGLKGDNSLVGQLDEASDRRAPSRTDGSGRWFVPMVNGKFQYLKDNGLKDKVINKHQGVGYGGAGNQLPAGDYSSSGITSKDESVNGQVSWQWICDELAKGEDVEIVYSFDAAGIPKGGHAVRVFECGRTLGIPWIGYLHDRLQTNRDADDSQGLETVRQWMVDLDGDGMPNLGSESREIRFAFSESADTDRDGVTNGLDNAPDHFNPGQEDEDGNGIGDAAESPNLVTDEIPPFDLDTDGTIGFGPFPNPVPPSGSHKDIWFVGTATASNTSSTRVVVSFDYVVGEDGQVMIPPKDTTEIPAGKTLEIFGSVQLDFCPVAVSVHFEALDGPASNVSGGLNHICYVSLATTCCAGRVGDCNILGGDEPTIGDISVMIDAKFITGVCVGIVNCFEECDVNQSGGANPTCDDITIGDISTLIDYLFITGPLLGLPECL